MLTSLQIGETLSNQVPVRLVGSLIGVPVTSLDGNPFVIQGPVAAGFASSGNPIKVGGVYNSTPPTLITGQVGELQLDANALLKIREAFVPQYEDNTNLVAATQILPLASATYSPSLYAPLTQVTKKNIKSTQGNVFSIYITNDNAAVRYFQLHDKASDPVATNVPLYSFKIPAGTVNNPGVLILDDAFFGKGGHNFPTGIGWSVSTTLATFTDSATNTEHIVVIHYK